MPTVYVQFTDSTQVAVKAVFGCPQDTSVYPNQGALESTDARYLQFLDPSLIPMTLAQAQAAQLAALSAACAAAIVGGFASLALGATHTYPSKITDQQNLASSVLDSVMAKASPGWAASTQYDAGTIRVSSTGVPYKCVSAGTSGAAAPAWPTAPGTIVNDGTAQWQLWTTPFWCADAGGNWAWTDHSADQIQTVGRDIKAAILACQAKNAQLAAQVAAATTVAAVQAITWN
ncbi:DUF4376 domain-containing protein [Paraburkholderia phenoliruptrix]|uniref:DUF4376 domain-containing protein n=1 Tax=Paraburkholderia phenoliruptrix TaxID=252970 RepID=UPI0034CEAB9F